MMEKITLAWWKLDMRLRNEKGQGMVEYGIILALVAAVCIGLIKTIGTDINGQLQVIVNKLQEK